MTPDVVSLITALIGATGGVIVTFFIRSFREWRERRKNEAQRVAKERDQWKQTAMEARRLADTYHDNELRVKDGLYDTRRIAMTEGDLSSEDLPEVPPDPPPSLD